MKTATLLAAAALATAAPAQAQDTVIAKDKVLVLGCLEAMGNTTSWPQCAQLMFKPCEAEEIATDAHASCLGMVRTEWSDTVKILQDQVFEAVTPKGSSEVIELMGLWTNYVSQKCDQVAAGKQSGAQSARIGCEISEFAGLSGEFAACLEGRSTAEFCEIRN